MNSAEQLCLVQELLDEYTDNTIIDLHVTFDYFPSIHDLEETEIESVGIKVEFRDVNSFHETVRYSFIIRHIGSQTKFTKMK